MKSLLLVIASIAFSVSLFAEEAKVVTLKGTGTCAKCTLKTADKCTNVLQVTRKKDGKLRTFTFTENMEHGEYFCKGSTENLVVKGTVEKKDGKLLLTPISVKKKDS